MVDFIKLFQPFLNFQAKRKRKKLINLIRNSSDFLQSIRKEQLKSIRGTFIYHRPPDYAGRNTRDWSEQDWIKEFKRLQNIGITTVIYQGAIGETTEGDWYIYYPISEESLKKLKSIERRLGKPPILDPRLDDVMHAAEKANMELHLGLYNAIKGWFMVPRQELINQICQEEIIVARDLISLYKNSLALKGWYISPEIMFLSHGWLRKLEMQNFLKPICQVLKSATPQLQIGISPGSYYKKRSRDKLKKFWLDTLKDTGIDLIYPMDTVGNLITSIKNAEWIWKLWKEITEFLGIELWANCELFERNHYNAKKSDCLITASFDRFKWQLSAASPFASQIITWEVIYFLRDDGSIEGDKFMRDYYDFFSLNNNLEKKSKRST